MTDKKPKASDYEALGKALYEVSDVYADKKKLFRTAFLKGIFSGLGGVVGATLFVGLLLWALALFDEVPLIGRFTENLRETVQQNP